MLFLWLVQIDHVAVFIFEVAVSSSRIVVNGKANAENLLKCHRRARYGYREAAQILAANARFLEQFKRRRQRLTRWSQVLEHLIVAGVGEQILLLRALWHEKGIGRELHGIGLR